MPTFDEVKTAHQPSDTLILDRQGEVIHRLRSDASVRRGQWVTLPEVSAALRSALVLSEDKRFYEHSGVDWQAVSAAAWGNLWNRRTRGASTLTMQLAGLIEDEWHAGAGGRNVLQKLGQTVAAQTLERRWRKDQILEAYLNLVPFRGEVVGIDALSRTLFGKAAHGLDARESALAVALLRAPNASASQVARRACGVLREMRADAQSADCEALELYATGALQRRAYDASAGIAPHAARRLLAARRDQASVIRSTLHGELQRYAVQTLQRHLRELRGREVQDGALVVLDNASGEVLAWVGSSGELSQAAEVDGVTAPRQPGSTLKPFLYAQALAERRLTAASLLDDTPTQIATAGGLYVPQNYDHRFLGWISVRTALAASLNVPAVRTLAMVSPQGFARQLGALGLPLREGGDYYGYSLALGSAELPLLALTNAYRALANGGRWSETTLAPLPRTGSGAPAARPTVAALDPGAAFIVSDILSDGAARARTFGLDSVLATRIWSAVKTGTSKDMRDNWAIGYSRRYTIGVWVGNASGAPMRQVSGASGAAPVWADLMHHLHRQRPSLPPPAPPGVERRPVRFGPATHGSLVEAARDEWFLSGTGQPLFAIESVAPHAAQTGAGAGNDLQNGAPPKARIVAPVPGSVIALDPDIPPANQRVLLRADAPRVRWLLDGQPLGRGQRLPWLPWPGHHRIALVDEQGRPLDEIAVEVRGAAVRTPSPPRRP